MAEVEMRECPKHPERGPQRVVRIFNQDWPKDHPPEELIICPPCLVGAKPTG